MTARYQTVAEGATTTGDWTPFRIACIVPVALAIVWSLYVSLDAIAIARKMMGATFGSKAEPGTIRGDLGVSNSFNLIHGSDSPESAQRELGLFFKPDELLDWTPVSQPWVYDLSKGQPE